jgi:hypothetical protein
MPLLEMEINIIFIAEAPKKKHGKKSSNKEAKKRTQWFTLKQ